MANDDEHQAALRLLQTRQLRLEAPRGSRQDALLAELELLLEARVRQATSAHEFFSVLRRPQ